MGRYRKKAVVVEAWQWTHPSLAYQLEAYADGDVAYDKDTAGPSHPETGDDWGRLSVKTLEGNHFATPLDWLIKGVRGEFYFCKPDVFEATYEAVDVVNVTQVDEVK